MLVYLMASLTDADADTRTGIDTGSIGADAGISIDISSFVVSALVISKISSPRGAVTGAGLYTGGIGIVTVVSTSISALTSPPFGG